MITSCPYPDSSTVVCSMGQHERCEGNCPCDCHLLGRALPAILRMTVARERRLQRYLITIALWIILSAAFIYFAFQFAF